jgi:hypothetical protein
MNDDMATGTVRDSLTTAKDSLTEVHMSTPLDTIERHGRATRRRHRLIGVAATGAVAVTAALAVGLTGVTGSTHRPGIIRTAAFTLVSNANGTATLTIKPQVLVDPGILQRDLRQDGIPAIVTVGSFCTSDPTPAGFSRVVSFSPKPHGSGPPTPAADPTVTFHPAAMPAGAELSFGDFRNGPQTYFTLIDTSSHTCASTPTNLHGGVAWLGPSKPAS